MSDINAYHEAGHAFMANFVGAYVLAVSVEPDWDEGPARQADIQVQWPLDEFTPRELCEKQILVALAGPAAEMLYRGEPYHPGLVAEWAWDWTQAWDSAANLISDQRARLRYLEQQSMQLYHLLDQPQNWAAVAAISDELLAHDRLDGEQVAEIIQQWLP